MSENNPNDPLPRKIASSLMYVSQIAWTILSPIILGLGLGYAADSKWGGDGKWTLAGIIVGVLASARNVYVLFRNIVRNAEKNSRKGKNNDSKKEE